MLLALGLVQATEQGAIACRLLSCAVTEQAAGGFLRGSVAEQAARGLLSSSIAEERAGWLVCGLHAAEEAATSWLLSLGRLSSAEKTAACGLLFLLVLSLLGVAEKAAG